MSLFNGGIYMAFYPEYVKRMNLLKDGSTEEETNYKINYLKQIIKNDKVYKFIGLNDTPDKNEQKINTLLKGNIWFSQYKILNDQTEFQINYNARKIAKVIGCDEAYIRFIVDCMMEIYDIYSLTYEYSPKMWKNYASDGNGICIEYNIEDYDYLFPVEYVNKGEIDFNNMLINALQGESLEFAILPWVIKNPYNETASLNSTDEKEVRILFSPYDDKDINNGKVDANIKEELSYKGISKPYSEFGLSISKIIVGNKCDAEIKNILTKRYGSKIVENLL